MAWRRNIPMYTRRYGRVSEKNISRNPFPVLQPQFLITFSLEERMTVIQKSINKVKDFKMRKRKMINKSNPWRVSTKRHIDHSALLYTYHSKKQFMMGRFYNKTFILSIFSLFLAKEGSQDKRILENKQFIIAWLGKRHIFLQIHHDFSLNHVVIGLIKRYSLFEDSLLADVHELAQHFDLYFTQSQSLLLSLCLLHGHKTDVIWDIAHAVNLLQYWLFLGFLPVLREFLCFRLLIWPNNKKDMTIFIDSHQQFQMKKIVNLEIGLVVVMVMKILVIQKLRT